MKKVLFTATVDSHILAFHLPFLKWFKENGYEVHVATNGDAEIPYCDKKIKIHFERSPFKLNNIKAIFELRKVLLKEKYDIIHTHTPMGSVVTRLAAKSARKHGTRVIYTAHGFHFFKGAPLLNWALFYPVEKYLSKYTDTLILINKEDYNLAKKKFKKCIDIQYVPGVGIDEDKFNIKLTKKDKHELRESLGLKDIDFVMIYPAELSNRKRQIWLINTVSTLLKEDENIHLLLPGKDSLNGKCQELVKHLKLENQIHFLGFRKDIPELLQISDLSVSSSRQEGLPVNIMEAMYVGLPIVASDCRGNRDLVKNGENGYIVPLDDSDTFIDRIKTIYGNKTLRNKLKKANMKEIKSYMLKSVLENLEKIYNKKKIILHVLASNKFSGAENVVCTIIKNMSDSYDMIYCSPKGSIENILKQKDISFAGMKKLSLKEINRVIKKYNPDIIHAHDYKASVLVSLSKFDKKIISHLHNNCPFARKWNIKSLLYRICTIRFEKIIGVSDEILTEAIFKKNIEKKYTTIYNFIDKKEILKKASMNESKKYDIFFIGRLTEQKNPKLLIKILSVLIGENNNITAIIIGDGDLKKSCQEQAIAKGIEKNVTFTGFLNNPFPIIKNSKIGIMPSKWEGFGLTAIESLILNKPVLNSGVGGLKEIFSKHSELICNSLNDYVIKCEQYLNNYNNNNYNYDSITDNYTNLKRWKSQLLEIYEEFNGDKK